MSELLISGLAVGCCRGCQLVHMMHTAGIEAHGLARHAPQWECH